MEVCETVLRYKDHNSVCVSRSVIRLLPRLATLVPEAFVRGYFQRSLAHIFTQLRRPSPNQSAAFIALGESIGVAVRAFDQ